MSGLLLDRFGRKNSIYVLNILALLSWILMASASSKNSEAMFIQLVVSRILIGKYKNRCAVELFVILFYSQAFQVVFLVHQWVCILLK